MNLGVGIVQSSGAVELLVVMIDEHGLPLTVINSERPRISPPADVPRVY
jgi:hypothetical protein